jgi:acyl phosphate:glycerol-3-phosphate acyltransferase
MSGLLSDAGATAAGYAIGSIPFGLLLGRATRGLDVREVGSGSMGSTNVLRAAGPAAAGATFALDVGKGTAAVFCARALGADAPGQVAAGLAAMVGHSWPVFAGFRGGKSVATAFGAMLAISPVASACAVAGGLSALAGTRTVSVGSLVAAGSATVGAGVFAARGGPRSPLVFAGLASALIAIRHSDNLRRLARGVEPRLGRPRRAR